MKVRRKDVGASEDDPAYQVDRGLELNDVTSLIDDADPDLRRASSIAAFAELLKGSPFVTLDALAPIGAIVSSSAGSDPDRLEFVKLFGKASRLLSE